MGTVGDGGGQRRNNHLVAHTVCISLYAPPKLHEVGVFISILQPRNVRPQNEQCLDPPCEYMCVGVSVYAHLPTMQVFLEVNLKDG